MYIVNEALQEKFIRKINDNLGAYENFIKEVNKSLLDYGKNYFDYTKGKLTVEYFTGLRTNMTASIIEAEKRAFTDMISPLEKLKEDYIKECFPRSNTADQLELDFIGKELEVMSKEELEVFYQDNFLDTNKMRLFDIEIKKRSRSNDETVKTDAAYLNLVKGQHKIQDAVISKINERIRFIDAMKQLCSGGYLYLVKLDGNMDLVTKPIAMNIVISAVNNRSTIMRPENIDIFELLNWR